MVDLDTYVITLHKPRALFRQLKSIGFNPKLFSGTNGKTLDSVTVAQNFDPLWSTFGPQSAHGIALSHLNLWKHWIASNSDNKFLLVLEDDVLFVDDAFNKLQDAIDSTPDDFDVLYLGCFGCQSTTNVFTALMSLFGTGLKPGCPQKINDKITKPSVALATHAYIVSKQGARKLIKSLEGQIFQHIDYCLQSLSCQNVINAYVVTPRIAFQTSTYNKTSSNVTNSHPSLLNDWLSQFEVDTMVRANYLTTLSIGRMGTVNVTISTVIIFLLGLVMSLLGVNIVTATLWYLIISLPDLPNSTSVILFHYIVFIIPLACVFLPTFHQVILLVLYQE